MKAGQICIGLESTAHTFGVSIVDADGNIFSDVKDIYKAPKGSGIHPREASRHHSNIANEVIQKALDEAKVKYTELDIVSYSAGPGIGPCLRVGATAARALSLKLNKPLVPVNHAIGHIELGCLLTGTTDPVNLLVSGGHTMILGFNSGRWRAFGETLDLTIGQLIDQIGRYAGYRYPAGATIEKSGSGFQVGDVLGIDASGVGVGTTSVGRNAKLSVLTITNPNEIILDNVQGNFVTGNGKLMTFTHPITGITTSLNTHATSGVASCRLEKITTVDDGLHFTVDHRNHGMHHETNLVQVEGVQSDVLPTKLSLPYNASLKFIYNTKY